jgi:hypothetical protein
VLRSPLRPRCIILLLVLVATGACGAGWLRQHSLLRYAFDSMELIAPPDSSIIEGPRVVRDMLGCWVEIQFRDRSDVIRGWVESAHLERGRARARVSDGVDIWESADRTQTGTVKTNVTRGAVELLTAATERCPFTPWR